MISSRYLYILALLSNLSCFARAYSCAQLDTQMGATFDLTDLTRTPDQPAFQVADGDIPCTKNVHEQNYTYLFNICGPVSGTVPKACSGVANTAGALQINERGTVDVTDDWCYMVGEYSERKTTLDLLNEEDPTEGVVLTYSGAACGTGKIRQFHIEMQCADKMTAVPTHAYELKPCEYTVTMPSVYGCPLECPIANRHLCGGNGHCLYDYDAHSARCFCNHGYSGSACSETSSSSSSLNYSPALLGLIVTLFIIVVALAASVVYMGKQMSAYKEDLANYQVLKGGEDENVVV